MAYSANQTTLFYRTDRTGSFTQIPLLREVPEFGGTPEKIDVTTLSGKTRTHIPGTRDYGDLVFKFLYNNSVGGNYRILKELATKNTSATFQLRYPDGTAHEFKAIPSVKMDAGTINGALTFSATMLLQSDIEITNGSAEGSGGVGSALPEGLLRSRVLAPDDYTITPQGNHLLREIVGFAVNSIEGEETHNIIYFGDLQYGSLFWSGWDGINSKYPVATAIFSHDSQDLNDWRSAFVGIPADVEEIQALEFHVENEFTGTSVAVQATTVAIESFTTESGFDTFRVYGEFEVNLTRQGGDMNTIAYSMIVGARPSRRGDTGETLFAFDHYAQSGARFELISGSDTIAVLGFGIKTDGATNRFVQAIQHVIEFNEPLQPGDTVNFSADVTTVKSNFSWTSGDDPNYSITTTQPIDRQWMTTGRRTRDETAVVSTECFFGQIKGISNQGFRETELFEDKITIRTGLTSAGTDYCYGQWLAAGTTVETLDIHHLEVISRT